MEERQTEDLKALCSIHNLSSPLSLQCDDVTCIRSGVLLSLHNTMNGVSTSSKLYAEEMVVCGLELYVYN
mgnify:CR=1 FL=1